MNEAHKIGRQKNRLARLVRKLKNAPTDDNKLNRKNELALALTKAGVKL